MNSQRSATRSVIRNFLRDYPKTKEQISLLGAGGIGSSGSAISAQDFFNRIDQVLSNDEVNIGQWLKSVNSGVIQPLDSAADRLILSSAIKVGVKTAISPRGVIDSLIVLTHSWLLIRNLCRLYNLRPNGWEICIIFGFSGFNALVSDKGDDAASSIQKEIADNGANYVSGLAANALGLLTSRAAEGSVNGLLIHRLGYQVKKYIRPISS